MNRCALWLTSTFASSVAFRFDRAVVMKLLFTQQQQQEQQGLQQQPVQQQHCTISHDLLFFNVLRLGELLKPFASHLRSAASAILSHLLTDGLGVTLTKLSVDQLFFLACV